MREKTSHSRRTVKDIARKRWMRGREEGSERTGAAEAEKGEARVV